MTMNVTEHQRIIKILKKWISYVDCPNEREIYADMIVWVEQNKPHTYYERHAKTIQTNINTLLENSPDAVQGEDAEVFDLINKLVAYHGSND